MGLIEQKAAYRGNVLTSFLIPKDTQDEIKRLGIPYRALIIRGLKAIKEEDSNYKEVMNDNKAMQEKIAKLSIRLSEFALESDRLKRLMEAKEWDVLSAIEN